MGRASPSYFPVALIAATAAVALLLLPRRIPATHGSRPAPGGRKRMKTGLLETGAALLQGSRLLDGFNIYLVGFHPMKDDPHHQMEAHHFCRQVTEDFAECVLFDGNTDEANLIGIEYIVSERLFERLPEAERRYWHPHNGEILSGQLVAPGLPRAAEHALMREKLNSYGKTWHVWDTGTQEQPGDDLPLGEPKLMWSFNRLGEAREWLIRQRDERLGIDTEATRRNRQDLVALAHPQWGIDDLKDRFPGPTRDLPGVRDRRALVEG